VTLLDETEGIPRLDAAVGLVGVGSALGDGALVRRGVRVLTDPHENDHVMVRMNACALLAYVAHAVEDHSLLRPVIPRWTKALESEDPETQLGAAFGLIGVGAAVGDDTSQEEGARMVGRFVRSEPSVLGRGDAALKLALLFPGMTYAPASTAVAQSLIAALRDVNESVQHQAEVSLQCLGTPEAREALRRHRNGERSVSQPFAGTSASH